MLLGGMHCNNHAHPKAGLHCNNHAHPKAGLLRNPSMVPHCRRRPSDDTP